MKYIGNMANNMGTVARTGIRLGTTIAADTTVGAAAEGITTKDLSASGFLSNMGMSLVGNVLGLRDMARRNGTSTTMQKTTLDKATVDGTKAPGGKFRQNFNKVKKEVASELPSANSERAAQIYKEGDKLQTQSRTQGKEIEHMVQDEVGFVEVGKERIDIATADEATLAKAKKAVESWDSTSRDKAGMLDKINARQAELEAGKVSNPKAPARSTEVVDRINTNVEQSAENILSGKKGALAPHDAATLEDHLVNSLNTKEEIEQFKSQLRERVGVDDQGRMFKYEVQGKDHAADLIAKADKKLKQLADFDDVLNSIPEQGGMGDMTSIRSFMNKPTTTAEQLETLIAKMEANPAIRKYSGGKKLISDMKMQVEVLNAKKISTHVAPKKVDAQTAPKETGNALPKKKVASDKAIPDTASPSNVNHAQGAKAVAEVKNFINNIKDTEIPAGLRNSWSSCKKRLSDLTDNLTSKNKNVSKEQLVNSARSILQDLKQISSRVTGSLKAKIDNLIAKVQTMCQKYGIEQKLKKADKLLDDIQDAKDNYELGENIAEVIIDPTNEKAWNNISENLSGRMLQDDPISSQMQSAQNISNDIIEIYNDPTDVGNYVDGIFDMRDAGKYHYHNTHNNSHSGDVDVNYGHNSYTDDNVVITEDNRQNSNIDDCVDTDDSDWSGNLEVEDNSLTDNSIGDDFGGLC